VGMMRFYRTDGATNEDWYSWHVEVHAPFDGIVIEIGVNSIRIHTIRKYAKAKNWPVARRHIGTLVYGLTHWTCLTCRRFKGASGSRHCPVCRSHLQ
jgi:hypothetical protein